MLNHQIKSLLFIEYQCVIFIQQTPITLSFSILSLCDLGDMVPHREKIIHWLTQKINKSLKILTGIEKGGNSNE